MIMLQKDSKYGKWKMWIRKGASLPITSDYRKETLSPWLIVIRLIRIIFMKQ